jgi:quercetin dioxygenase-like cupin family protein/ligand-binding sensor protein
MDGLRSEIERMFNLKIVGEQFYSWGESYWLQLNPNAKKIERTVSIVSIYPNIEVKKHTHPNYEEFILGLKGEAIHWCNGREVVLREGAIGFIPAGGEHGISNQSGKPAQMMSIVYPAIPVQSETYSIDDVELGEISQIINLEEISEKFAESYKLAVTLIDQEGKLMTSPKNFPIFCKLCLQLQLGDCALISHKAIVIQEEVLPVFRCVFGICSVQSPIVINGRVLGYLGCGYGPIQLFSDSEIDVLKNHFQDAEYEAAKAAYMSLNFISRNHLQTVAETLSVVSASLVKTIMYSAREQQASLYKIKLLEEKKHQVELECSLTETRLRLLESQVNPHFLFNTLNTIAQLSAMEGSKTVASLTYALSNMLHRSLGENSNYVTISEELSYVKDYLFIQQIRFPNRFQVETNFSPKVLTVKVPFMTLMILVENAILHGFKDVYGQGHLKIRGDVVGDKAIIEVIDNGTGIPVDVIRSMKVLKDQSLGLSIHRGIGLKNIYHRLDHYYGGQAAFNIEHLAEGGTRAIIELPIK